MKNMKKYRVLICIAAALIIAGCGGSSEADGKTRETTAEQTASAEEEDTVEQITMTEKEQELLAAVYPNEEMIREGQLFEYQEEALNELRAGEEYITSKYPEQSFEIRSITPADKFYPWMTIVMKEGAFGECKVTVTPAEEGYTFTEDLYGKVLGGAYDKAIGKILAEGGLQAVSFTKFTSPMGEEVGPATTPEELIALKKSLPRNTHLFMADESDRDAAAEKARQILLDAGVYGAYTLYFVPDILSENVTMLEEARTAYEHRTFNCFDIQ